MTNLARSTWSQRTVLDPLPHDLEQLVDRARRGQIEGQLPSSMGLIADVRLFVVDYALCYLTRRDPERALECLQVAAEAVAEAGLQKVPAEDAEELPGKAWPIPPNAVFRPCEEPTCRKPITQIVTRIDGNGDPVYLPVTTAGRSHFEDCTNPKKFSRSKKRDEAAA